MIGRERAAIAAIGDAIERARIARDASSERAFRTLYGGDTSDPENDAHLPV